MSAGAAIPTDSPRFWSDAYTLRLVAPSVAASGAALPAAPCFLLPVADAVLAAGKSALLLQAYSRWRLAAAAARRSESGSAAALAAAEAGFGSPAKRRLSEYGALGFAIAAGQQPGGAAGSSQHPYGVPPPSAAFADGSELLSGAAGDGPGPEPLLLHEQMVRAVERQLQDQLLLCGGAGGGGSPSMGSPARAAGDASSPCSSGSSSHACHEEWVAACAATGDHMLLLPAEDALPALPAVPASAEQLPAARLATIEPPTLAAAESILHRPPQAAAPASQPAQPSSGQPSIADRMRAAAAARVAQASCPAAEQLPMLIIPPAPLEALAASSMPAGEAAGAEAPADGVAAAAEAHQFDGGAWQQWYERVAGALSQQLHVLDAIHAGGSGGGAARQPAAGSYGAPLGLAPYSGASPSQQLWGRGGGSGGGGTLGAAGPATHLLQPELAAEAPPLDVLLQHSLLRPVQAQIDAAGAALCTALLGHGLLRQVRGMRPYSHMCPASGFKPVRNLNRVSPFHRLTHPLLSPPCLVLPLYSWRCCGTHTCWAHRCWSPLSASCCAASGTPLASAASACAT